jgi:C-terminal processing protease CtpA/Prc
MISNELKIYELSLIWKEAAYNFAFWERLGDLLDWDKAYKEAIPAVLKTDNLYDYYLELMKFAALLLDGHTCVWLPEELNNSPEYSSKLPIATKMFGGERIITNVKRIAADKVKRWSVIKKVNGLNMDEYEQKFVFPYIWHEKKDSVDYWIDKFLRNGAEGSQVELELEQLEQEGVTEMVTLTRAKDDNDWFHAEIELNPSVNLNLVYQSDSHSITMTDDGIAVITIDTMMNHNLPSEFYANFPLLEKANGYIIDVRKNLGGNSGNSDGVAAAFIVGEFTTSRSIHPTHIGAYKSWGMEMPKEDKTYTCNRDDCPGTLTAPLVVLSSADTASAAEDFLVALDYNNRATIVGSASYGSTGNPLLVNLESGGSFQICTRNCIYPDGREFINIGVQPHVPFVMTLDDYKNGVDSAMNKGLEIVREKIGGMA